MKGEKVLKLLSSKFSGEKGKYVKTLVRGIMNKKESKKKAILEVFEENSNQLGVDHES